MKKIIHRGISRILLLLLVLQTFVFPRTNYVHAETYTCSNLPLNSGIVHDCNNLPKNSNLTYTCGYLPKNSGKIYTCGNPLNAGGTAGYYTGGTVCSPKSGSICNICRNNYNSSSCPHNSGQAYGGTVCAPTSSTTTVCNICGNNYYSSACSHYSGRTYGGSVCSPYSKTTNTCNICGGNYSNCPHYSGRTYGGTVCFPYSGIICNICNNNYQYCAHSSGLTYGATWVPATPNTYHTHNSSCTYYYSSHEHTSSCPQVYTAHTHNTSCSHYTTHTHTASCSVTSSSSDPYVLTLGSTMTKTVATGSTTYFSFKTHGNVDLQVIGNIGVSITVFDNNNNMLDNITTTNFKQTYKLQAIIWHPEYIVRITSRNSPATISINASFHLDQANSFNGGIWTPNSDSIHPDSDVLYLSKIYVPKDSVADLFVATSNDKYLETMNSIIGLTFSSALVIIDGRFVVGPIAAHLLFNTATFNLAPDLKGLQLESLEQAGGYNKGTNTWSNGVVVSVYFYRPNGVRLMSYEPWTSSSMKGVSGYVGTFILN